jgi:hypothetical protein
VPQRAAAQLTELAKHKLGRRDIVANLNFFCRVPVAEDNGLDPLTFVGAPSRPGDHIELARGDRRTGGHLELPADQQSLQRRPTDPDPGAGY